MDHLIQDLRFAVRSLVKNPGVSLIAAASLALGIGAAASVFSGVDVFMIRPLAYPQSQDLVAVHTTNPERGWTDAPSSWPDFDDWRHASTTLELAAYHQTGMNLSGGDHPERLSGLEVSAGFLRTLRITPQLGRTFLPNDERASAARVVILANALWQRSFGADPSIVGHTVELDGEPVEVVGVLPPRFEFSGPLDLLVPLRADMNPGRESRWVRIFGRLRPGGTLDETRSEMRALEARLASSYPEADAGMSTSVIPLQRDWFSEGFRQGSLISSVAVLFVLLIACANVANLLLARGATRDHELALRSALGAGRGRIVRQLLTESVILGLVGGALGMLLSVEGIRWIRGLLPGTFPQVERIALNGRVVFFTLLISLGSGLVFGLAPAFQGTRGSLRHALSDGGRGGSAHASSRLRRGLVLAEISLSFVLLVSATLLVQAFSGLRTTDLGFGVDHRVTARLSLPPAEYPKAKQRRDFFRELEDRVGNLPGVGSAALVSQFPLRGANSTYYTIPEEPPVDPARRPSTVFRDVTPSYFQTMGMTLLEGRDFTRSDVAGAPRALIVNRTFADRHWPGRSPLGKKVEIASSVREIVGVVEDTHDFGPQQDAPAVIYDPLYQSDWSGATLVVDTDRDPTVFIPTLRAVMRSLDPDQPLYSIQTVRQLLEDWLGGSSAMAEILGVMAALAFLLASVGVYGVMALSVARRTREVGVRMALGAQRGDVLRLVLCQGALMATLGIVAGLAIALASTRFLAFFLYGVSPFDSWTFAGASLTLLLTCLAASWIPARRATRVDPILALRTE